jgi:hypothetical protein
MSAPNSDQDLHAPYLLARYKTEDPALDLRIGRRHPDLDRWLRAQGYSCWALITPHNPLSCLFTEAENQARYQSFLASLPALPWLRSWGTDPTGAWPPEEGCLIAGIDRAQATRLSVHYGQCAFVFGELGSPAELVFSLYFCGANALIHPDAQLGYQGPYRRPAEKEAAHLALQAGQTALLWLHRPLYRRWPKLLKAALQAGRLLAVSTTSTSSR